MKEFRKNQVSIFFITIMATLIVLAFVVVNVGKIAKDKTYTANAADAGALAAASVMATAFNYVSHANGQREPSGFKAQEVQNREFNQGNTREFMEGHNASANAESSAGLWVLSPAAIGHIWKMAEDIVAMIEDWFDAFLHELNFDRTQQQNLDNTMRAVSGNQENPDNYYNRALVAGYYYNFLNSGISVKVQGTDDAQRFEQFLQNITVNNVQSGMPMTFSWVDGAFRGHSVTAIVMIEPVDNWNIRINRDDDATQQADYQRGDAELKSSLADNRSSEGSHLAGIADPTFDLLIHAPIGWAFNLLSVFQLNQGTNTYRKWHDGQREAQNMLVNQSRQAEPYTIAYIEDIIHSQTVFSANFQIHIGGPIKGLRGDVDIPTFYPPVQSTSRASFNCNGNGDISTGDAHGDSMPNFESCLIAAF